MALITGRDFGVVAPAASALIAGDARASAEARMHVYAHMYRARILEALESQFPRLSKLVGPHEFAELSAAYIAEEPSRHPSLRYLGERLPAWLEARRPNSPQLADLARLEWGLVDVFDVVDEPTLTVDAIRAWPADRFGELPLHLIAAHRLVTAQAGTAHLVWREGTVVYHRRVDEPERAALELASKGTRFGVICEALLASHGEETAVTQSYTWISTWLADGLLRSI
jgi:hypothetical protein